MKLRSRIEQRLLWWRHAWSFHWAHHALCDRFHRDVVHLGDLHLCRSCACAWGGFLVVGALLFAVSASAESSAIVLLGLTPVALAAAHPALHSRLPRRLRDLARATLGATGATVVALIATSPLRGLTAAGIMAATLWTWGRLRAARRVHACEGCPELGRAAVCSGYRAQAEAIRRWEEAAVGSLLRRGYPVDRRRDAWG